MDPAAFVNQARDLYIGQFQAFLRQQRTSAKNGASEAKYVLGPESGVFRHMYCVDFVNNDGPPEVIELNPAEVLDFKPISGSFGDASLKIEHLRWDDMVIYHDAPDPEKALASWFERWFDPENKLNNAKADTANVIHSLLVQPGKLSLDMGSAVADSFWELLNLLETEGARSLRITASRDEAMQS